MTSATARTRRPDEDSPEWGPLLRGERRAGRVLARTAVSSALTLLLGALVAAPLALAHLWRPIVALPVLLVVVAASIRASRHIVSRPMPPWTLAMCLFVAVGAGVWAGATHDQHVVLRRDAGSYALYGQQLASAHELPIDIQVARLGGAKVVDDPDVAVASPGFYREGSGDSTTVVPQFLIGVPAWLSVGMWLGGWTGLLLMPAILIGFAIASVGALAAATIGPRWAPLVALATAVTQPVLHAARSTYSEPGALLVLTAAMAMLASATETGSGTRPERARRMAVLAGFLLGAAGLVRPDALREVVLVVPFGVLLAARRHPVARPLLVWTTVGTALATVVALTLNRTYLRMLAGSFVPLVAAGVVFCVAGVLLVRWLRRREAARLPDADADVDSPDTALRRWVGRWLPTVLAGAVVLVGVVLATRPLWQSTHQASGAPSTHFVAALQKLEGIPGDGSELYSEQSVNWVVWWVGPAAALLALSGAALAAYRTAVVVVRNQRISSWVGPFFVGAGSIVLTLWRPGITPDHPWADRRLVVAVLPGTLLLAAAAVAMLVRMARRHAPLPVLGLAVVVGVAALVGPALQATAPVAGLRTEMGEVAAVQQVCRTMHPGDVDVVVGERAYNEWPELLRGVCHVPTLIVRVPGTSTTTDAGRAALGAALARIGPEVQAAGGHVVLVSDRSDLLVALGTTPTQLVNLQTREDPRLLTHRPEGSVPLVVSLWSAPVAAAAG